MTGGSPILIEPDIDRYGQDARVSALADYLELAALAGHRVTIAALQDLIVDNEWVRRPIRRYLLPEDVEDDPDSWADAVFAMIAERGAQLGDLYPFEVSGRSVRMKDPSFAREESRYLSLLAITVVHACGITGVGSPEAILEDVVADTLAHLGISSVNIGATDRGTGFVEALQNGAKALDLWAMQDPRPRSSRAKDVGVDTLAGFVWRDHRQAGHWLVIGQVTAAQSQHWAMKLAQPEPARWATYLQELLHPQVFLAVPHHVQDDHLRNLMESRRGVIIDRLRIVANKADNTIAERVLIKAMLDAEIERP